MIVPSWDIAYFLPSYATFTKECTIDAKFTKPNISVASSSHLLERPAERNNRRFLRNVPRDAGRYQLRRSDGGNTEGRSEEEQEEEHQSAAWGVWA